MYEVDGSTHGVYAARSATFLQNIDVKGPICWAIAGHSNCIRAKAARAKIP
jgi:hypothetical protein